MSERTGQILRILTVVAFLACGVMAWRLLNGPDPVQRVESDGEALDVMTAIGVSRAKPMTVRGYLFEGPGVFELRMCNGRRGGSPPSCVGPYISLENVDRGSFELREGTVDEGVVRWSPEPVTATGVLVGTLFTVQVVLS